MVNWKPPLSDNDSSDRSKRSNTPIQEPPSPNQEEIYQLLDKSLSFEACLFHQVFPLALEGNRVVLGMVNPEDTAAIEYVGRILSYMNYSLVVQPMVYEAHQAMLSAYLNRNKDKQVKESRSQPAEKPEEKTAPLSANDKPTFILVQRENLASLKNEQPKTTNPAAPTTEAKNTGLGQSQSQTPAPQASAKAKDTGLGQSQSQTPAPQVTAKAKDTGLGQPQSQTAQALPDLEVQANHRSASVEVLKTLPPKKLLQELLGRVLEKGIGRLYFEQKSPQRGRIICSQNGNLQSALPDVPVQAFQAIINELKQLTHLPLEPVKEPVQAEIERFYQKERLLLRLRLIPGTYGEQATLQILRGAALQFYQQQQVTHQDRDSVAIANQLQQKLNSLRERTKLSASYHSERYESLMALDKVLDSVEQQLENLKKL